MTMKATVDQLLYYRALLSRRQTVWKSADLQQVDGAEKVPGSRWYDSPYVATSASVESDSDRNDRALWDKFQLLMPTTGQKSFVSGEASHRTYSCAEVQENEFAPGALFRWRWQWEDFFGGHGIGRFYPTLSDVWSHGPSSRPFGGWWDQNIGEWGGWSWAFAMGTWGQQDLMHSRTGLNWQPDIGVNEATFVDRLDWELGQKIDPAFVNHLTTLLTDANLRYGVIHEIRRSYWDGTNHGQQDYHIHGSTGLEWGMPGHDYMIGLSHVFCDTGAATVIEAETAIQAPTATYDFGYQSILGPTGSEDGRPELFLVTLRFPVL